MEQPVGLDFHPSRTNRTRKTKAVTWAVIWSLCSRHRDIPLRVQLPGGGELDDSPLSLRGCSGGQRRGSVWLAWVRMQVDIRVLRAPARMGALQHRHTATENRVTVSLLGRQTKV